MYVIRIIVFNFEYLNANKFTVIENKVFLYIIWYFFKLKLHYFDTFFQSGSVK